MSFVALQGKGIEVAARLELGPGTWRRLRYRIPNEEAIDAIFVEDLVHADTVLVGGIRCCGIEDA